MTNTSRLLTIIADNAIEEANDIRNYFAHGEITFEQANESLLSLRKMLRGVRDDLDRNGIPDETDTIRTALRVIKEIRDTIYEFNDKVKLYEYELRKQFRVQIYEEYQRG
jgi:predicted DNA-binding protein YlxM (UPF0122 family)